MAARTLGQLRAAVQDLGYGTDTVTTQNGHINTEYRNVAGMRRWRWLQAINNAVVTIAGQVAYTLPMTDLRNLDAVWVVDAQDNQFAVKWLDPLKLLDLSQDLTATNRGAPRYWSYWGGQLWLYPTPDAVYSLTIAYTKNPTPMGADGDSPLIPEAYDDILVWGAVARMAFRQRDWLGRDFARQSAQVVLAGLLADYQLEQRQTPLEVEETGIWNQGQASSRWR